MKKLPLINFLYTTVNDLAENELSKQLKWYKSAMISLDSDPGVKALIYNKIIQ